MPRTIALAFSFHRVLDHQPFKTLDTYDALSLIDVF